MTANEAARAEAERRWAVFDPKVTRSTSALRAERRKAFVAGAEWALAALAPVQPTHEQVWQAITGSDEPWGGCADGEAVERVMALLAETEVDR